MSASATTTREITLRFLAEPSDVNFGGKVHGGAVMRWIDQRRLRLRRQLERPLLCHSLCGGIRFLHPILIGHLVEVTARVIHTGRTSMHIAIAVRAGDPRGGGLADTTHCTMVFVAVSSTGGPVPVHPWVPATAEDVALENYALKQMELRQAMEAALSAGAHR